MASTTERVRRHRARLKAQGIKAVQLWLPDVSAPGFAAEAARQSRMLARADSEDGVMEWLDEVNAWAKEK